MSVLPTFYHELGRFLIKCTGSFLAHSHLIMLNLVPPLQKWILWVGLGSVLVLLWKEYENSDFLRTPFWTKGSTYLPLPANAIQC